MNQERRPITVEDLLRLKRAEKPAAEFWSQFDRELRAKQLAALVAKRPWWQRFPRYAARFAPYRLPLGAAAALAVTFISVRNYSDEPVAPAGSVVAASMPHPDLTNPTLTSAPMAENGGVSVVHLAAGTGELHASEATLASAPAAGEPLLASAGSSSEQDPNIALELSRSVPLFGATEVLDAVEMSPSARSIAVNRRVAELPDAFGAGLLTVASGPSAHGFESRAMPVRAPVVDPLQQMTPPGESRRPRYVAAMVSTVSDESLDRTTARMAHRISGEELYEQVQRFGTRRGGFNVKF